MKRADPNLWEWWCQLHYNKEVHYRVWYTVWWNSSLPWSYWCLDWSRCWSHPKGYRIISIGGVSFDCSRNSPKHFRSPCRGRCWREEWWTWLLELRWWSFWWRGRIGSYRSLITCLLLSKATIRLFRYLPIITSHPRPATPPLWGSPQDKFVGCPPSWISSP